MAYAEGTKVPADRSRAEIEHTLRRYGAEAFSYAYDGDRQRIAFRAQERMVRFDLELPPLDTYKFAPGKAYRVRTRDQQENARAQDERRRWRALLLVIKAKLEAVESGIATFEEEFLANVLLPNGQTMSEWATPQIDEAYTEATMPSLLPGVLPGAVRELPRGSE